MTQSVIDKPLSDDQLLKAYAHHNSQDALAQLVHRHIDHVYTAARRQLADPQSAEDATQAVFIVLAKKARHLVGRNTLPGWLMKATHFAARDIIKKETRRKNYEREAAQMRSTITPTESAPSPDRFGEELDAALAHLGQSDRNAISLRYLHGLTMTEAAASLAISPEAATKRIGRAVARLRKIFVGRGIIAPSIALPALLDQLPHMAAPAHLAATVTSTLAGGTAAGATISIAQGVTHMMTAAKIKAASILVAALLLTTGAGVGGIKLLAQETATTPNPASTDAGPNPPPAPGQVVPNPPTTAIAQLNNGVSVEIIGLCESPSHGKQWWDASGALLDTPPYDSLRIGRQQASPGYIVREVAIKVNQKIQGSNDVATVRWGLSDSAGSFSGGIRGLRGQPAPKIDAWAAQLRDNPAGATLHASVAAGKWTTLVEDRSAGPMSMGLAGMEFVFSQPYRIDNETHITLAAIGVNDVDTRLVVYDKSGKQHTARGYSMASSESGFVGDFGIDLPIASIQKCEFQTRPLNQWIEIKNISLHAGKMTDVQISTSDQKPK
jgi:RNA polymerase sigma factor (sigma-70 family)